ncbi:MAG: hypothetical protein FJ011_03070 [Chloroflexi bacterium]|nr:hypothetical protein [Chloroflexota bacterium]
MSLVSRSLRLKVGLGVSLALIALLTPFNWLQYQFQRRMAIADLSQLAATTGVVTEHSLEGAMLTNNWPAIQTIVDSVARAPDVQAVYLLNPQAIVAVSPGGRWKPLLSSRSEVNTMDMIALKEVLVTCMLVPLFVLVVVAFCAVAFVLFDKKILRH